MKELKGLNKIIRSLRGKPAAFDGTGTPWTIADGLMHVIEQANVKSKDRIKLWAIGMKLADLNGAESLELEDADVELVRTAVEGSAGPTALLGPIQSVLEDSIGS